MRPVELAGIALAAAAGVALGAVAMFAFDPDNGRRRRALARDKLARYRSETVAALESAMHDLRNRAMGTAAEARGTVSNVMSWTGPERRIRPRGAPAGGAE
jgi:hypothetical protein